MENILLKARCYFNAENTIGFKILADSFEQRDGWIFAIWNGRTVAGVREKYLKAFYLENFKGE